MKVSALRGRERTIIVTVPGSDGEDPENIGVTYRPGAVDIELAEKIEEIAMQGLSDVRVAEVILEPMLVRWDLQDEDGSEWGVTAAHIRRTPLDFLGQIIREIQADARPNPQKPAVSEDGSPQEENQGSSQNGTSSFEQQTGTGADRGSSSIVQ